MEGRPAGVLRGQVRARQGRPEQLSLRGLGQLQVRRGGESLADRPRDQDEVQGARRHRERPGQGPPRAGQAGAPVRRRLLHGEADRGAPLEVGPGRGRERDRAAAQAESRRRRPRRLRAPGLRRAARRGRPVLPGVAGGCRRRAAPQGPHRQGLASCRHPGGGPRAVARLEDPVGPDRRLYQGAPAGDADAEGPDLAEGCRDHAPQAAWDDARDAAELHRRRPRVPQAERGARAFAVVPGGSDSVPDRRGDRSRRRERG
mmetsp:Transcript_89268/g.252547  ORF Transcript_89268/g.252547 Transcript_89268/m.252547 type:complete len:259 (-) Transcript_89268:59-835(-)